MLMLPPLNISRMDSITQDMRFRLSLIEYSLKHFLGSYFLLLRRIASLSTSRHTAVIFAFFEIPLSKGTQKSVKANR